MSNHVILNVVGALVAGFLVMLLAMWTSSVVQQRTSRRGLEEASVQLGVPVKLLEGDEGIPLLAEYLSRRLSSDLLQNRVSDLCHSALVLWGWLTFLVQFGVVVGVGWSLYQGNPDSAAVMWALPLLSLASLAIGLVVTFVCHLLTGRYPGQAKGGRKWLSKLIAERGGYRQLERGPV